MSFLVSSEAAGSSSVDMFPSGSCLRTALRVGLMILPLLVLGGFLKKTTLSTIKPAFLA
ncbi:MAG: hypothetical protein OSP8Acid_13750 [uncultured Acidilobus sp. OSP8]|jgi:hypothetical protein|nr:MAG: hypothetical protein OSP8Acid_13750 [uncultured Acidilobus sp. OSP8]